MADPVPDIIAPGGLVVDPPADKPLRVGMSVETYVDIKSH